MANFLLSAFADEAGKDLETQIKALKANKLTHIEPRGLDYGNISTYSPEQAKELKKILDDNGIGVSSVGSPVGKVAIDCDDEDMEEHFEMFKNCVEVANILDTKRIRMFSFFIEDEKYAENKNKVFELLDKMADYSLKNGVYCCHENEKDIYGDNDERCLEILSTFKDRILGIFDPSNFIQCGVEILPAYDKLEEYIDYFHVKDCRFSDGKVVPAGQGDGHLLEILSRFSKKDGDRFLTLEPHLSVFKGLEGLEKDNQTAAKMNQFQYASKWDAFTAASNALHDVLSKI